jgi:serine/threonine protein kinase
VEGSLERMSNIHGGSNN